MAEPLALKALRELGKFLSNCSTELSLSDTERLIDAFSNVPGKTLDQKIKAVRADWKRKAISDKSHSGFCLLVEQAEQLFAVTGPKGLKNDLSKLRRLLSAGENVSAAELAACLKIEPAAKKTKSSSKPKVDAQQFSDELVASMEDKQAFDQLVSELMARGAYTQPEINKVARIFLGYDVSFKTKAQAAKALQRRQADMAIGGAQIKQIEALGV
jgi:hypothetical protein